MICTTNHHIAFGFFSYSTRNKQKLVLRPKPTSDGLSKLRFKLSLNQTTLSDLAYFKSSVSLNQTTLSDLAYFKSSGLLCWRSDLVFSNLRVHFLNTLKALHLCWAAVRNHKVVAFVGFNQDLLSQAWHTTMCDLFKSRSLKRDIYPSVSRAFWWSRPVSRLHNRALRLANAKLKLRKSPFTPKSEAGTLAAKSPKVTTGSKVQQSVKESAFTHNKAKQNVQWLNAPESQVQAKFNLPMCSANVVTHQPYALLNQLSRYVKQLTRKMSRRTSLKTSGQIINTNGAKTETRKVSSTSGEVGKSASLNTQNQTPLGLRKTGLSQPLPGLKKPGLGQKRRLKHPKSAYAYARLQSKMDFNTSCLNAFMHNHNFTGFFSNPELSFKTNLNHYKHGQTGCHSHMTVKGLKSHNTYGFSNLLKSHQNSDFGLGLAKSRLKLTQTQRLSQESFGLGLYGFSAYVVKQRLSPVTHFEVQAYKRLNNKLKLKTSRPVDLNVLNPGLTLNTTLAAKNSKSFSTVASFIGLSLANLGLAQSCAERNLESLSSQPGRKPSKPGDGGVRSRSVLKNLHQNLPLFYLKTHLCVSSSKGDRHKGLHSRVSFEAKRSKMHSKSLSLKSRLPKMNYYDQGVLKNLGAEFRHFVLNPNLKQADLIFFSNPNKTPGLAKQARYLNIPTIGLMSGLRSSQNPCDAQIVPNVSFGILGNPENGWLSFNTVSTFLSVSLKASARLNTHTKSQVF